MFFQHCYEILSFTKHVIKILALGSLLIATDGKDNHKNVPDLQTKQRTYTEKASPLAWLVSSLVKK
jgi:hypothetical protein